MRWPWNMLFWPRKFVLWALRSRSSLLQAFFPVSGHSLESPWWTRHLLSSTITLTQPVSGSRSAMPTWHHAGPLGVCDQLSLRSFLFCPSHLPWHLSHFQMGQYVLPSYCWAQQVSQIKPDCCLYFKAEQLDKACFKRSFLLFIENNSSQGKTELGHQCPGQNLPGSWRRGEQMEAYLDTTLDHGPDAIICKDTHVCALVTDFLSLLLEHWVRENVQSLSRDVASEAEISGEK